MTVTVLAVVTVTVAGPHAFPTWLGPPGAPDGDPGAPGEPDCPEPPGPPAPAAAVVAGDWPVTKTELVNGTGMRLMVDLMVTMPMPVPVAVAPAAVEFPAGNGAPPEPLGGNGA